MQIKVRGYLIARNPGTSKKTGKPLYWYAILTASADVKRAMANEPIPIEALSVVGGMMRLVDLDVDATEGGLFIINDWEYSDNTE